MHEPVRVLLQLVEVLRVSLVSRPSQVASPRLEEGEGATHHLRDAQAPQRAVKLMEVEGVLTLLVERPERGRELLELLRGEGGRLARDHLYGGSYAYQHFVL